MRADPEMASQRGRAPKGASSPRDACPSITMVLLELILESVKLLRALKTFDPGRSFSEDAMCTLLGGPLYL